MRLPCPPRVLASATLALLVGCDTATTGTSGTAGNADAAPAPPGGESPPTGTLDPPPSNPPPQASPPGAPPAGTSPSATPPPDGTLSGSAGQRLVLVAIETGPGGNGEDASVQAAFVDIGTGVPMSRLLALLAPDGDRCWQPDPVDASIAPLTSIGSGETLIVDGPAGTWATLARTVTQGFVDYRAATAVGGALPDGATLSISADPRPGAMRIPLPDRPPAFVVTALGEAGSLDLAWQPATGNAVAGRDHLLLDVTVGGFAWRCELQDDGGVTLDERLLPRDEPSAEVRLERVARVRRTTVPLGEAGDTVSMRHLVLGTLPPPRVGEPDARR